MLLLAIDTSTPAVTAGVLSLDRSGDGSGERIELLSEHTVTSPFAHAERLMPLVNEALAQSGHRLGELDAIVVGLGPGPFTGLRVGIATAQALGDALGIAVHGVASHDAMAGGAVGSAQMPRGQFLVVTDARRREVYLSAYEHGGARSAGPTVVSPAAVQQFLSDRHLEPTSMLGAGTGLVSPVLPDLDVVDSPGPLSLGLVRAALSSIAAGAVQGPLTPLYLRRPDATEPGAPKSVLGG